MDLQKALHDLTEALNRTDRVPGQEARLRGARRVLIMQGIEALEITPSSYPTFAAVIAAAACAPQTPARRRFAALMIHAFTMRGLVPTASASDVCVFIENALRDVLLRAGYPFGGSTYDKCQALERLHATIGELLEPLQPTFPNWQGLYSG